MKFFNHEKGWGFITSEDGDKNIFVHHSAASGEPLNEGDNVTFNLEEDQRVPSSKKSSKTEVPRKDICTY